MQIKTRQFPGTPDPNLSPQGIQNRRVAREAAAEGMVLLENDGVLPMAPCRIALYGPGARFTVKGGTGSGDVYARNVVSIEAGLQDAGFVITTAAWLNDFDLAYQKARKSWTAFLADHISETNMTSAVDFYLANQFAIPDGRRITPEDIAASDTDVAFYVIARVSGEGADRRNRKGDFQLTETEWANLECVAAAYSKTVVIINAGGMIDLSFMDHIRGINGLIYALLPGVEGGNALADIITGAVSPSGKLADTWAVRFGDYPSGAGTEDISGKIHGVDYKEDIYVGYRYFDSFNIKPRYPFGFGKSYTSFSVHTNGFTNQEDDISITVSVTNTGHRYAGKEVIQAYGIPPCGRLRKAGSVLASFGKTRQLSPGDMQEMTLSFNLAHLASYDEQQAAWVLEKGRYDICVGTSSRDTAVVGYIQLDHHRVVQTVTNICPLNKPVSRMTAPVREKTAKDPALPFLKIAGNIEPGQRKTAPDGHHHQASELSEKLPVDALVSLVVGAGGKSGQTVGNAAEHVPGAAGETTGALEENFGIPRIVLADGPAGLRLAGRYKVDDEGKIRVKNFFMAISGAHQKEQAIQGTTYYQSCTAMPIETLLAQTWNLQLVEEVGRAIGCEMAAFGVTLLLAPGLNIHRHPLCGRNFEYFSEDPLLTGKMAAAITRGVQSLPGIGTTLKHFACNNMENDRHFSDSRLSEQALREIYLKGFEIAVREAQPMAVMTSYNLINSVRTATSHDLCTRVLRDEWGFQGLVMTDWLATDKGRALPAKCIRAGNDLIMPGLSSDVDQLLNAVEEGELEMAALRSSAANILNIILKSNRYENCQPYLSGL